MQLPFEIPARHTRPWDVVTLGLNSIDLVARVTEYPVRNSKQALRQLSHLPGGQMATAAAVCARLGWRARYIGSFGSDEFAVMGRASLEAEGVDVSAAWNVDGATSQFAIVIVDDSGDRTVLWNRHPGLAIRAAQVPVAAVTSGRLLIVDCHETAGAAAAATAARRAGVPTIVDVEKVRPGIEALLSEIDAIIAAQDFPAAHTGYADPGRAIAALASQYRAPLVSVTLGAEGSLTWCGGREFRTAGFAVNCVDTTGAGDAFRGGFAAGCLRLDGGRVEDVLEYANAVAALNCRALGARGGMPTADEVDALIVARSGA